MDLLQDASLAVSLATQFGDWLQNGAVDDFLLAAGLIDASGSVLPQYAGRIQLSGHSLGGHLALWTASQHPDLVARVDTFNGAGLNYQHPVVVLLETLWNETIAPGANALVGGAIHNYYAEPGPEVTATGLFGYRPGEHVPLFIETRRTRGHGDAQHGQAGRCARRLSPVRRRRSRAHHGADERHPRGGVERIRGAPIAAAVRALGASLGSCLRRHRRSARTARDARCRPRGRHLDGCAHRAGDRRGRGRRGAGAIGHRQRLALRGAEPVSVRAGCAGGGQRHGRAHRPRPGIPARARLAAAERDAAQPRRCAHRGRARPRAGVLRGSRRRSRLHLVAGHRAVPAR